jgi:hypothetical protein
MANDHHGPKGQEPDEAAAGLKLSDALKKLITAGIGAAFMTEESIRNYVSELKLPKDVLNMLLQSAAKSKEELMHKVGNEIIKVVNRIDFVKEASRFVEEHKFKIKAEVEVVKKDLKSGHSVSDKDS